MKIAFLSAFYPFRGGVAQFNSAMYRELEKSHQVKAFTFSRQYPDILFPGKSQYVTSHENVDPIPALQVLDTINPFTYRSTANAILKFQPDLLIMKYWMTFFSPSLGSVAYLLKKKCKIITIVDNALPHERRFGDKALSRFFFKQSHGFVAMSRSVLKDLEIFTGNPNKVFLPHPIFDNFGKKFDRNEALDHLALRKNYRYLLFFGFIRKYKGLDLLLQAMADPRIRSLGIKLLVAGECYDDLSHYTDMIKELNIEGNVILKAEYIPSSDVKLYFCAADMVVQPYVSATQSGVTQIAYHFERPMLVTDVGGLAEIVPHLKVGYVVQPNAAAIADAIVHFYQNKLEAEFSANAGIEKSRFLWSTFVQGLLHLYQNLSV